MTRDQAINLLHKHITNINLRRHCYAVEAVMRSLAKRFGEDEDIWGLAGLIHDVDYEETKETAKKEHTIRALKWLDELEAHSDVKSAVAEHAWNYVDGAPQPSTRMAWSLYTCDELTGLIVAVALVKPEKKLSAVTVGSIQSKWKQKAFAAGVDRQQIKMCEERLGIALEEFIEIALTSMQNIHEDLGL
ncbi:HDIG domain-containing protein [Candidatus Woesebacteria bacterium]|nr:MAG: HDIG domain-containing protein [Candidatus Woesebacteria bacterium]